MTGDTVEDNPYMTVIPQCQLADSSSHKGNWRPCLNVIDIPEHMSAKTMPKIVLRANYLLPMLMTD